MVPSCKCKSRLLYKFFFETLLKTSIIPYSHFALCMCKSCWDTARPGWLSTLAASPWGGSHCLKKCCFLQCTAASSCRVQMVASHLYWECFLFQESEATPKEDRSISLFPSIEEWGNMTMKHFSMTPELSTNLSSLTPHSHPTFSFMHCELIDQVSYLSVTWSFLDTYPQETRERVHNTMWMPW